MHRSPSGYAPMTNWPKGGFRATRKPPWLCACKQLCTCLQCKLCTYKPFCGVISVSLHMSVITQDGDTALMMAAKWGMTVVPLLLKAGANIDLQNKVHVSVHVQVVWEV